MATNILMPALSPTMEEGKLAKWLVKEGDTVKSGTILAEIETDKATMEFEAVDEGKIGKILVPEGSEGVKVNAPIAVLLDEGEKLGDVPAAAPSNNDIAGAMKDIKARGESAKPRPRPRLRRLPLAAPAPKADGARIFASPLARRIAGQKGLDLSAIAGTGPRGRIVKSDVENAKPGAAKPAAAGAPAAAGGAAFPASRRCPMRGCSIRRVPTKRPRTTPCARPSPSA